MKRIMLTILITLVLLSSVNALGVAPSKKIIDFSPGKIIEGELIIINNQNEDFTAHISVDGMLQKYINFSLNDIKVTSTQDSIIVPYVIKLPNIQLPGGEHESEIIIFQEKESRDQISAQFAVISRWILAVPLSGKSVDSNIFIGETTPGELVEFSVPIKNTGLEDLTNLYATFEIRQGGRLIGSAKSDFIDLKSSEQKKVTGHWQTPLRKARFTLSVTVYYGDKVQVLERDFTIGKPYLSLTNLLIESFDLGEPAHMKAYVYNDWIDPVTDVSLKASISTQGVIKESAESSTFSIDAQREESTDLFFTTENLEKGNYTINLDIRSNHETFFTKKSLEITEQGANLGKVAAYTGNVVNTDLNVGRDTILIVTIIILIGLNLYWVVRMKKRRDNYD